MCRLCEPLMFLPFRVECPAQASHHLDNLLSPRQTVQEVFPHTAYLEPYHDSSIVRHPLNFLEEFPVPDNPLRDSTRSVRSSDDLVQQKPFPPLRVNATSSVLRLHPPPCQLPPISFPYTEALLSSRNTPMGLARASQVPFRSVRPCRR